MKKVLFLGLVLLTAVAVTFGNHIGPKRVIAEITDCENGNCEVTESVPAETTKDAEKSGHCEGAECVPDAEDLPVVIAKTGVEQQGFQPHTFNIAAKDELRDVKGFGARSCLRVNGTGAVKVAPDASVNFSAAYNDALEKAVESAKEKAEKLSTMIGAGDMKLVALKEISNNYWITYERAHFFQGEIDVSATVELVYLLIPSQKLDFGLQSNPVSDAHLCLDECNQCSDIPGSCCS